MPRHIDDLDVLPVFFNLKGKKAVIAGGTLGAAWKAELLAACGADVHVYATATDTAFEPLEDRITLHRLPWSTAIFENAALALCDAPEAEAKRFRVASKSAGVPVNVIDQPALCDFQFGSIINRSPVVVSVSTSGAAPILGQAIRRRIEAVLPLSLKHWAAKAVSVRGDVNAKYAPGVERRRFWDSFSLAAFSGALPSRNGDPLGQVQVGARTNKVDTMRVDARDPELLTLKAIRLMQSADVIYFDDCIGEGVLELARREARFVPVAFDSIQAADEIAALGSSGLRVLRLVARAAAAKVVDIETARLQA